MLEDGALSGVRVLDLSRMLPGPYCSMILADHGAEVIAIERKEFKETGLFFNALNRNKKHMTLDLKTEQGVTIFLALAAKADVIIEGFRPGVVKRLGIDYDTIRKMNPAIIYCSISGYGQSGARRDLPGHDVNYISTAGLLGLVGEKDRISAIPGVQLADIAGGSMNAALGILLALRARDKMGKGQYIDISMTDGILGMLALPSHFAELNEGSFEVGNSMLSHRFACYNTYETKDGRSVSLGAVENKFWKKFCEHVGHPELTLLQYDEDKKEEVIGVIRKLFLAKTYGEWVAELEPLAVCFSGIKSLPEVFEDKVFKEREMILDFEDNDGCHKKTFGIPVKLSETPGTIRTKPSRFGADTKSILADLGYSAEEVADIIMGGVV